MTFAPRWTPPPRLRDLPPPPPSVVLQLHRGTYTRSPEQCAPISKSEVVRDEGYRRLVASLPCFQCHIRGYSQAAHPNTGKAKGMKQSDDECFPLCCDRPGIRGCHSLFDQYLLVSRSDMQGYEARALEWTRQQLQTESTTG